MKASTAPAELTTPVTRIGNRATWIDDRDGELGECCLGCSRFLYEVWGLNLRDPELLLRCAAISRFHAASGYGWQEHRAGQGRKIDGNDLGLEQHAHLRKRPAKCAGAPPKSCNQATDFRQFFGPVVFKLQHQGKATSKPGVGILQNLILVRNERSHDVITRLPARARPFNSASGCASPSTVRFVVAWQALSAAPCIHLVCIASEDYLGFSSCGRVQLEKLPCGSFAWRLQPPTTSFKRSGQKPRAMVFHFGQQSPNHFSTELVASPVGQRVGLRLQHKFKTKVTQSDNDATSKPKPNSSNLLGARANPSSATDEASADNTSTEATTRAKPDETSIFGTHQPSHLLLCFA